MQESGVKDYELSSCYGLLAPRGVPDAVIATVNQAVLRTLKSDDVRTRLRDEAAEPIGSSPEQFQKYLMERTANTEIVRATGMQPD